MANDNLARIFKKDESFIACCLFLVQSIKAQICMVTYDVLSYYVQEM